MPQADEYTKRKIDHMNTCLKVVQKERLYVPGSLGPFLRGSHYTWDRLHLNQYETNSIVGRKHSTLSQEIHSFCIYECQGEVTQYVEMPIRSYMGGYSWSSEVRDD